MTLTPEQFDAALLRTRMRAEARSVKGARLVLVEGQSARRAAVAIGISNTVVSNAVLRIAGAHMGFVGVSRAG